MRKLAALLAFVFVVGAFAMAQMEAPAFEVPKNEIFGGYAWEHADLSGSAGPTLGTVTESSTNLSGFAIEFSHYFSHALPSNFGYTLEIARVSNGAFDPAGDGDARTSFLAGPTVRLHRDGFFLPAVHGRAGVNPAPFAVPANFTTLSFTDTDIAVAGGASLDGNLSRHLAVRLAQVDYVYSHHYGANQSSFRYTGGIVLRF